MDPLNVSLELAAIGERTFRITVLSLLLHVLAGGLFLAWPRAAVTLDDASWELTEVTWLDPVVAPQRIVTAAGEPEAPVVLAAAPATAPAVVPAAPAPSAHLEERVASLLTGTLHRAVRPVAVPLPVPADAPRAATAGFGAARAAVPSELARTRESTLGRTAAPRELARAAAPAPAQLVEAAASSRDAAVAGRTILPGISLAGPVSDRALLDYTTPAYPEWAKRAGVEVSVELGFTVLPNGTVKENVLVERTSGHRDFDERARTALAAWRFAALAGGATAEQWGRIQFNYRLKDAGRGSGS